MAKAQLDPNLFPVTEHTLKNGQRVRLQEDHAVPTVTYYTFFRVGSRKVSAKTGSAASLAAERRSPWTDA